MTMDKVFVAKIFKALCDENRISIIEYLQSGEKCACNIGEALGLAQSKLSYHMKILCDSKIVESWNVGKWTHYKISEEGSKFAASVLRELTKVDTNAENCISCKEAG